MAEHRTSRIRRLAQSLALMVAAIIVTLIVAEVAVRFIKPQDSMYPRWQYSAEYGFMLYPNRTMVHEKPGRWRFTYTTNDLQYRGPRIPITDSYTKTNIVILGDSYTFGTGVNDDEVFAAVLADSLRERYDVVNLGVGGWGLSQEIRRYYEFGALYDPRFVILQYCGNDLLDNLRNPVTDIENGKFVFHNSVNTTNWIKRFLSDSIIQRSQLYNLVRQPMALRAIDRDLAGRGVVTGAEKEVPVDQKLHADLLETFARDLRDGGRTLILIQVDHNIEQAPYLAARVRALEDERLLTYLDVERGLEGMDDFKSKEGHRWGRKAHRVIGKELARTVVKLGGQHLVKAPAALEFPPSRQSETT